MAIQVIQCADYGGPYRGSFIPMLTAVAHEAAARGHRSRVLFSPIARDRPWLSDFDGLARVGFLPTAGSRAGTVAGAVRRLGAAIRSHPGPTVIHTHFAAFDIPAGLTRLGRRSDLAVFWHEHGPLFDDPVHRWRNAARHVTIGRMVSAMLCVSPEVRQQLRARHAPADRLIDVPNAIDTDRFSPPSADERRAARGALGLGAQDRVALHFGWDWQLKGGDLMLAAADRLSSAPEVRFLTVMREGSDPVARLAGHPNVQAVAPSDDVRRLYAAADVFLGCSRYEGLPLAVLEALACGLPVVVTDLPVQARLTRDLPGAQAVAPAPAAVADALRRQLWLSGERRVEHAARARARIEGSFALDAWARDMVDRYEASVRP